MSTKGFLILLLVTCTTPLVAAPLGLLDQPQTFPWTVGLSPVIQEEAGGLEPGKARVRSSLLWFNTYRQYGLGSAMRQQIDMEALLLSLSGAVSFAPGWEVRGQVQGWATGGGVLDLFLSGFHGGLGVPNQGRDLIADGGLRNYWDGVLDDHEPYAGLTQASLGVRAFSGPWSLSLWVKPPVPAHQGWGWSDRWGAGAGLGWGDRWPWPEAGLSLRTGLSTALVTIEQDSYYPGQNSQVTAQGAGYAIVDWFSGPRVLVQASYTAVPRSGPGYIAQGAGLLTLGTQFPFGSDLVLELAMTEEFLTWATNEVGFQVGWAWNP